MIFLSFLQHLMWYNQGRNQSTNSILITDPSNLALSKHKYSVTLPYISTKCKNSVTVLYKAPNHGKLLNTVFLNPQ